MEMQTLQLTDALRDVVQAAHRSDEPVIVFDGRDECLVAMRPAVFERILFAVPPNEWVKSIKL